MFDEDDNFQIDKEEFFKIVFMITHGTRQPSRIDEQENAAEIDQDSDEYSGESHLGPFPLEKEDQEQATEAMSKRDTTLTIHLFGRSGQNTLSFDEFQRFYHRLQREIIEIEFNEFSRGKGRISTVDFARLVLRYSILHKDEQSPYIKRAYERSEYDEEGISLQQFEQFSMFLNNLEDFSKAVRLYALADIPVSQSEFIRAVKCSTGFSLDPILVNVLYKIFDANADDKLSYREFIAVMSDRLSRGFKSQKTNAFGWRSFKDCVRNELSGIS